MWRRRLECGSISHSLSPASTSITMIQVRRQQEILCFQNVNVVDVERGAILFDRSVTVQKGRIEAITRPGEEEPPSFLDCQGRYLSPGLIDSHVHFFLDGSAKPRESYLESDTQAKMQGARRNAKTAIQAGITTMRDCAAPAHLIFQLKRSIDRRETPGPHIITCGHALMRPGGHCHWIGGGEVTTVQEVRTTIERLLCEGAGFVKLMASGGGLTPGTIPHEADFPLRLMRAAAEAAHANGVHITAHCHATESIRRAIVAGLDMIEHANFLEPPGRYRFEESVAKEIRDRKLVISPTVVAALRTARRFRKAGHAHNPADVAAIDRLEGRFLNTREFRRLGINIIGGTDCGATDTSFDSLVDEILLYKKVGFSNQEALRTVTSDSARFLNLKSVGKISPGYRADLLLTAGNPLEDLNHLRAPLIVFKSGEILAERDTGARASTKL